ncbi:MAG: lysine--tRNA ligase [Clostridia bacterium]|nr:lysine--tRNA ligase [Clostridia bacterium]
MEEQLITNVEVDEAEAKRVRKEKLDGLVSAGQDPFTITAFDKTHLSAQIKADYDSLEGQTVRLAGRMIGKRIMGKASFAHLLDGEGTLQFYVRRDDIGEEEYRAFKQMDIGDIVGIEGFVFKTKTEEISVHVQRLVLLAKSLLPLPEKYHGLRDTDLRYRQRYVDLIANPEVKNTFVLRSRIITEIRRMLNEEGFIEVETPILNTVAGGATARPFITHHNTLDIDMYLRIAPELYLKRLIVGGFEKVYEIGRLFRNEGMDVTHNPEFTTIELYQAYVDFNAMMDISERIFHNIAKNVLHADNITYQGTELQIAGKWKRQSMNDAVLEYTGVDCLSLDVQGIYDACREKGLELEPGLSWGKAMAALFDTYVEENLIQPVFIYDYPVEISPLAKKKPSDPRLTERFEIFIVGHEFGNAFSELNDPIDQRERFMAQARARAGGDEEAQMMDDDYVTALEYGLPPTGGLGIGIDRMVMLFTDNYSIRDVLLFPTMKPRK